MKTKKKHLLLLLGMLFMLIVGTLPVYAATSQSINLDQLYFMEPGNSYDDSHYIYFTLDKPAKVDINVYAIETMYGSGDDDAAGNLDVYLDPVSENDVGTAIISYCYGWNTPTHKEVVLNKGTHRLLVYTDFYVETYSVYIQKKQEFVEGPATAIKLPKTATVTKGMSLKLQPRLVNSYETLTGMKWSTSKKSVATVSKKGVVTAKKKGTAIITCTLKNGKKYKCKIIVKDNVYKGNTYSKLDSRDYKYGQVWMEPLKMYYSGKQLKVECAVLNSRMFKAKKFTWITLTVYDGNSKVIAKNKFKNVNLNINAYGKKKVTFSFPANKVKKKKYDLRKDKEIYISYDYYYTYKHSSN